jgi:sugar lactone lactonase YvrE
MTRVSRLILLAVLSLALLPPNAHAWIRTPAETFATLPPGAANPEGITADARGNIYTTLFSPQGTSTGNGQMFVFSPSGRLLRHVNVSNSSPNLLGLAFHPTTGDLLVIDFGAGKVLNVDPVTGASSVFATVTGTPGLNALTFDGVGNVYISDSFQGIIWKTGPNGAIPATAWVTSTLLTTGGVPPFGANGIGFNKAHTALFVANTGNDTVVKIPVTGGNPGTPAVFVNSINGADGLIIDDHDNIWVCANQADEIVVIDPTGRVIAKLGDFGGIDYHGAPIGLLFPASLVFSGEFLYVTNLSLDLRLFNQAYYAVDSQWAAQVSTHTLARIPARIPPVPGLHKPDFDDK